MNKNDLPSQSGKKYIERNVQSADLAESILDYGLKKKNGKYYVKYSNNGTLYDAEIAEEAISALYDNDIIPVFLEISKEFISAYLSYNKDDDKDKTEDVMTIFKDFKSLIELLDLIDKYPKPSYDIRQAFNKCKEFLKYAFEYQQRPNESDCILTQAISLMDSKFLLLFLSQQEILPQNYFDNHKIQNYLKPILLSYSTDELVNFHKKGYMNSDTLSMFVTPEKLLEAYRLSKRNKYLKAISCTGLCELFLDGKISSEEIAEAKTSPQDFYNMILDSNISPNDLILLACNNNFEGLFPNSDKLLALYKQHALGGKTMLKLITLGKVNPEAIPNIYASEHILQNAIIIPQVFEEDYLATDEDFVNMFSVDFMLQLEKNGNFTPKLIDFYKSIIVPFHKDEQKELYEERRKKLEELEIISSNLPTILKLAEKGIFSINDITALNLEDLDIPVSDLSYKELCILYSAGKIDETTLLDISPDELINCLKNGFLTENALDILNSSDFIESYSKGRLDDKDLLHLYDTGKIEFSDLDCISPDKLQDAILTANVSVQSITNLFLNKKINYDTLQKLHEEGKITDDAYTYAIDSYDIESEMEKIRQLSSIQNNATPESLNIEPVPHSLQTTSTKKKVSIDPELRNEFLDALGAENPLLISTGALKGYMFIPIPNLKTVVLEKLYNSNLKDGALTPALDNATFVLPFIKALELATSSNKTDLRKLDNVYPINHTKNWGLNILKAISKRNPQFEYKRYKEDYSDLIELIAQNYIENRGE